jgi:hypothetical protein
MNQMIKNYVWFCFILSLGLFLQSCSKDYFVPPDISETDIQSFSKDIQPIFTKSCLGSGCHSVSGGLVPFLESAISYDNLIGGNYVDTLNPAGSKLYVRISANSNTMPPTSKLPPAEIKKILIWIKQGAQNN